MSREPEEEHFARDCGDPKKTTTALDRSRKFSDNHNTQFNARNYVYSGRGRAVTAFKLARKRNGASLN